MSSSTAPTVPEGPNDSTQDNESTVNLQSNTEIQIEASTKYWKAVGSQAARRILKTTEEDSDIVAGPIYLTVDPEGVGANRAVDGTDLQLIEALFFSFAITRSKLIGSALKPFKDVEVPDIEDLPMDMKVAKFQGFYDEIHKNLPKLQAALENAGRQDYSFWHIIHFSPRFGDPVIENLRWITNIDLAVKQRLHYRIEKIDKAFMATGNPDEDLRMVNYHFKMACYAVGLGCQTLHNIASGYGNQNMVHLAIRDMGGAVQYPNAEAEAVAQEE